MSDDPKVMVEHYRDLERKKILEMEPGRELDALVAEKVMGWQKENNHWRVEPRGKIRTWEHTSFPGFQPSTDISAAWEVVEKLRQAKSLVVLIGNEKNWECRVTAMIDVVYGIDVHDTSVSSKSAPEAICKAALLAVMDL